jgi:serine/threonine-protein kinase PknK
MIVARVSESSNRLMTMNSEERELVWLRQVRDFAQAFASESDLRKLLAKILDAAIEITGAERGFLVRVVGAKGEGAYSLQVDEARGFDQADLGRDAGRVSRTVVSRVLERGDGLVTTSDADRDVIEASSVQAQQVVSIVCFPMSLRGVIRGVLYLDHRSNREAFRAADLPILRTFADQAAFALETAELRGAVAAVEPAPRSTRLLGKSPAMEALRDSIDRVARSWEPVLVLGESGTGKELVAREIHARGALRHEPFLAVNCAAVAESLLESELFGHSKGSFSGAEGDRKGLFEQAGKGTIFLDEVGDMSLTMQSKLLRVLQEREVRPVGSHEVVSVDCRVIAATHQDLSGLVAQGKFRADLYYRLDVLRVRVAPLRQRTGDVEVLLEQFCQRSGLSFTPKALNSMSAYSWPGNIRQLQNEVRRLVALGVTRASGRELSPEIQEGRGVANAPGSLSGKTLAEMEQQMVTAALAACAGNKAQAARQLGIPRSTLYDLIER